MKNIFAIILVILTSTVKISGQDTVLNKINTWLAEKNFAVRQTFDVSKDENKPASILFRENHKTPDDFLNVDLAVKLAELELLTNKSSVLLFYPKVEWHKSSDLADLKNKLDGGLNVEFIPFGIKSPNLPDHLPNKGLIVAPWVQGIFSCKRNFIECVYETKLTVQFSLVSNYRYLPGSGIRDGNDNFRARYYPYFGVEYNLLPGLLTKGVTEEFSTCFVRLFAEIWIIPQTLQLNIDGTYREIIRNETSLRTSLPLFTGSLFLYPGRQESLAIGYEYKHGYDNNSRFQLIQISAIKLAWKI